jgi:phage gp16-like protein
MEGPAAVQRRIEALEQQLNMDEATDLRHQKWMANRMAQAMQFPEVREALKS